MLALFEETPKRLTIMQQERKAVKRHVNVAVYRNHSFEMIASALNSFFNYTEMEAEFIYSDYDDSLNFQYKEADIQLIWIDINRYNSKLAEGFVRDRALSLRSMGKSPILIAYTGNYELNLENITTDCYALHVDNFLTGLGQEAYDEKKEAYSGTRLSNKASLKLAQILGLKYFPALLQPSLKAIIVDLDNTLYQGILGEDGIEGLKPYCKLQQKLKELKQQGFFLCIASKNEEQDVKTLFAQRTDFPLRWEDFAAVQINWDNKADNISKLAKTLNINTDAMLFIDDNPAEIQNVEMAGLGVKTILAEDPETTLQMINYFPGLLKLKNSAEDAIRATDVRANVERAKLAQSLSPKEYFEKLGIKLIYGINREEQITRVAELFGKTNQFILTYARYKETDVKEFMQKTGRCIITIHMSDNLSDSGIIAILAAHKQNDKLEVDELTVSCRALGRNLENIMLPYFFVLAQQQLGTTAAANINYQKGDRNAPAINWLKQLTGKSLSENRGTVYYPIPETVPMDGLIVKVM